MGITEQFAGLDMHKLIGAPLTASADASIMLADSTADFIHRVGFVSNGNTINVAFTYEKKSVNEDGTTDNNQMKVEMPMLALVPIPNLQIDEVAVNFDMEVKHSESSQVESDTNVAATPTLGISFIKVSVAGCVSEHRENTRSSDNTAKYKVSVAASNHATPEGLARVLDMMAENVAPALDSSKVKDASDNKLSDVDKIKADKIKTVRAQANQLDNRMCVAQDNLDYNIPEQQGNEKFQTQIQDFVQQIQQIADDNNSESEKASSDDEKMFVLLEYREPISDNTSGSTDCMESESNNESLVKLQNNAVQEQCDMETVVLKV